MEGRDSGSSKETIVVAGRGSRSSSKGALDGGGGGGLRLPSGAQSHASRQRRLFGRGASESAGVQETGSRRGAGKEDTSMARARAGAAGRSPSSSVGASGLLAVAGFGERPGRTYRVASQADPGALHGGVTPPKSGRGHDHLNGSKDEAEAEAHLHVDGGHGQQELSDGQGMHMYSPLVDPRERHDRSSHGDGRANVLARMEAVRAGVGKSTKSRRRSFLSVDSDDGEA